MSDLSTATTANLAVRAGAFPSAADALAALTPEQLQRYEDDGYLVLPGFASRDQLLALQERAESIVAEFVPPPARTVFTTSGQEQATDDYMLDSGDKVCCFFEKGALSSDGSLCVDKNKSINKIGHGLHEKDPVFRAYSDSSPLRTLARSLGLRDPRLAQSMYIFKQPRIGGEVGAHQDSSFLYTSPASCVGLWVALDDATEENGCMYAVPGSHKEGLKTRYTLVTEQVTETGADGSTTARTVRKTKFTPPLASAGLKMEGGVCLAVPAGSLVVLHGALVHYSFANLSAQQRHAYTLHIVEGPEYAEWAKDNWMQRDTPFPAFTQ